jgi:outer membrane PBP1 activator LpoA protein
MAPVMPCSFALVRAAASVGAIFKCKTEAKFKPMPKVTPHFLSDVYQSANLVTQPSDSTLLSSHNSAFRLRHLALLLITIGLAACGSTPAPVVNTTASSNAPAVKAQSTTTSESADYQLSALKTDVIQSDDAIGAADNLVAGNPADLLSRQGDVAATSPATAMAVRDGSLQQPIDGATVMHGHPTVAGLAVPDDAQAQQQLQWLNEAKQILASLNTTATAADGLAHTEPTGGQTPMANHIDQAMADVLSQQQNLNRALAITRLLQQSPFAAIRAQNYLPYLQALLAKQQWAIAQTVAINTALTDVDPKDRVNFSLTASQFLLEQQLQLAAAELLLNADALSGNHTDPALWQQLWPALAQLNIGQLAHLNKTVHPRRQAWIELVQRVTTSAGDANATTATLQDWQARHPGMPAGAQLPSAVQQLAQSSAYAPRHIGVVLPLSGQFKALGQAVQQGLLAAQFQRKQTQQAATTSQAGVAEHAEHLQLTFIDSQQDATFIVQALQSAQVDFVIGPLLRDDVDKLQQHADWRWPTLFLNSKPQTATLQPDQFFFALSMEDEAKQMVRFFSQKQHQHPVLIYAENPVGKRMAEQFKADWQRLHNKNAEIYSYRSKDELQPLIANFLETSASTQRVAQMTKWAGRPVKAEPHSRLDVDAIYLIADPAQTRMFKPFIDVTVSPTAPALPIYVSSRSHSLSVDRTDIRDLNGITMTEVPWLVPGQADSQLRQEFDKLYPDQDETLQRLFAMGVDALHMVGRLKQQQHVPALSYHGLTGRLTLDAMQQIQRQLTLAQYRQGALRALQQGDEVTP